MFQLPIMPTGYKPELTDLLKKMMQKDPADRPSADDILRHDYFKGARPAILPKVLIDAVFISKW